MGNVNFVIRSLNEQKIFENSEMCKYCTPGCRCCESSGCAYSPEDFYVFAHEFSKEDRIKYLKHFIKRGKTSFSHRCLTSKTGAIDLVNAVHNLDLNLNNYVSLEKLLAGEGALFLRVRNKNYPIVDVVNGDDEVGPCILWDKDKGCPLPFNKRPKGARQLRPKMEINGKCIQNYTELQAAIDWYPYQDILFEVYKSFI